MKSNPFEQFLEECQQQGVNESDTLVPANYPDAYWSEDTLVVRLHEPASVTDVSIHSMAVSSGDGTTISLQYIQLSTADGNPICIGVPYPIPKPVAESQAFTLCVLDKHNGAIWQQEVRGVPSCALVSPSCVAHSAGHGRA